MTITKTITDKKAELKLSGWLDTQSAPQLAQELQNLEGGIDFLSLDLAEVEYISSAGLRQLVAAYKQMNGSFALRNVSDELLDVIHMTGLDRKIRIET